MTVAQLLRNISSEELSEWIAYMNIINTPEPEPKDDPEKLKSDILNSIASSGIKVVTR